jgi:hypothetical protein
MNRLAESFHPWAKYFYTDPRQVMPEMYVGSATVFALVRFESIFGVMDGHDHKHRDDHLTTGGGH